MVPVDGCRYRIGPSLTRGEAFPYGCATRLPVIERLSEACGVFGIYAPDVDVARTTFFGLYALQHRGQESAGIAVAGHGLHVHKDMGLVSQVFNESSLAGLSGHSAIGHTRYSTTGSSRLANAQPILTE